MTYACIAWELAAEAYNIINTEDMKHSEFNNEQNMAKIIK
jgi:hypothetical protein